MASDARFFGRLEENFFGRDVKMGKDALHDHGSASIKYGRGAVLTVDLTNRCNMMCNPCFMDANQVGYVHELSFADIREILDNAVSIKPRRQLSVQFSGGEPTISPFFLEATRYAKEIGYFSVQCATNGIRFAQEPGFAAAAYDAGLRLAYLQFDGVGNEHNTHRGVGNLYDVKLQALDNLHAAGIDVTLVTTLVNYRQQRPGGRHPPVRDPERRQDQRGLLPARFLHGPRRGDRRRDAQEAALHARPPRARREGPGRNRRADARLVSPLRVGPLLRSQGPARRPRGRVGLSQVRLPPELRHRDDDARPSRLGRRRAGHPDPRRGPPPARPDGRDGLGPRPLSHGGPDRSFCRAKHSPRRRPEEPRRLGDAQGHGRAHGPGHGNREAGALPLARPSRGRHVVPGPLQLRLPPHGDVHHSVRHPARRDLVLRLQHGRRLAEDRRGDVPERHAGRVVQGKGSPPGVRPRQARPASGLRARAEALHAARFRAFSPARRASRLPRVPRRPRSRSCRPSAWRRENSALRERHDGFRGLVGVLERHEVSRPGHRHEAHPRGAARDGRHRFGV